MSGRTSSAAVRYWHTLRHLRAAQIYGRVWHRLHTPSVAMFPAPACRLASVGWTVPVAHRQKMIAPDGFCFLNEDGRVNNRADWNDPHKAKLWLYNLHYFDDLNAAGAEQRCDWHRALIKRWIAENPAPLGNGWEPYPLSLRIINWIKWALAGNLLQSDWQTSLAVQIRFLARRLEWHLLGNHLFANAKALVFAGLFFEGREADRWLKKGLSILEREIPEQILTDGGHFELSPMYHAIILEDMLDLINLYRTYHERLPPQIADGWRQTAENMLRWLSVMCHPDGDIAFFNDAAMCIAARLADLEAYAGRLAIETGILPRDGVTELAACGYIRAQQGEMVALLDVARIGPDYIPGHAHADTLSFELSLLGHRVIVNSGISQYGTGQQRLYERSTAAHSTLEVDGENSTEVWGGFRVARRARPLDLQIVAAEEETIVRCAHDGYRRLKGRVTHKREWRFRERSLVITDTLSGTYDKAVVRFFLHPDVEPSRESERSSGAGTGTLLMPDKGKLHWRVSGGDCCLVKSEYYPEFGRCVPSHCLELNLTEPQGELTLNW